MCKIYRPVINVAATAAKIKEYRIRAGYSVREIQNILSFSSPEAVYAYEKGKYLPSIDNMIILADVYGVTVDDFIVRDVIEVDCEFTIPETRKTAESRPKSEACLDTSYKPYVVGAIPTRARFILL